MHLAEPHRPAGSLELQGVRHEDADGPARQGADSVGEFRPERLLMAFTTPVSPYSSLMLH